MARTKALVPRETKKAIEEAERAQLALTAYQLRQEGKSWWEVAEELHLSEGSAKNAIANGLKMAADLVGEAAKRELLGLEISRIDTLQAAHWRYATRPVPRLDKNGDEFLDPPDIHAAEFVLKCVKMRADLQGLAEVENTAVQTVVVAGNSKEYVEALRLIAAGGEDRVIDVEVVEDPDA